MKYELNFKTPDAVCHIKADSIEAITSFLSAKIVDAVANQAGFNGGVDLKAEEVLKVFNEKYRSSNRFRTPLADAGLELDLIKCYMTNLTTKETGKLFKSQFKFKVSQSALGRYWLKLKTIDLARNTRSKIAR